MSFIPVHPPLRHSSAMQLGFVLSSPASLALSLNLALHGQRRLHQVVVLHLPSNS